MSGDVAKLRNPRVYKLLKVAVILLATAYVTVYLFLRLCVLLGENRDWADGYLEEIVNSVLEIPYFDKSDDFVIKRPDYIKTLSFDEWMNIKCLIHETDESTHVYGANSIADRLPPEQKWHLNCIRVSNVWKVSDKKDVNGELCNNLMNCQLINLAVSDYVLNYPEVLWSILKIIERPCDFIKKFDKEVTAKEITYDEIKDKPMDDPMQIKYLMQFSARNAKSAEKALCNNSFSLFVSKRKFVLLTVQDRANKQVGRFIVRRQDID